MVADPKQALQLVQALYDAYKQQAEALEPAIQALTELVETGEFTEQRRAAFEAAAPHLSPEALQKLGLVPSGASVVRPPKKRPDKPWLRRARTEDQGLD